MPAVSLAGELIRRPPLGVIPWGEGGESGKIINLFPGGSAGGGGFIHHFAEDPEDAPGSRKGESRRRRRADG